MRKEIPVPSGFVERTGIRSGVMYRKGYPDYGVIFTESKSPSEDDFDTSLILGMEIENIKAPPEETDRYFEILGGYFFHDRKKPKTTKVFGIALNPEFGIKEGGTTLLMDHWDLDDPKRERGLLEKGRGSGWTFIVKPKDSYEKFPHSNFPLKISVACPEVSAVSVTFGECVPNDAGGLQRQVIFDFTFGDVEPREWSFSTGDGERESGTGWPERRHEHGYEHKPSQPPTLRLKGHPACDEVVYEISLDEFKAFEPCPTCPEISALSYAYGGCKPDASGRRARQVTFTAEVTGDDPVGWKWDFGDGSQEEGSGRPPAKIEHDYLKAPTRAPELCLTGPNPCQEVCRSVALTDFKPCPPCPEVTRITHVISDKDEDTKTVRFTAVMRGPRPDTFEWDWGDGSPAATTTVPTATHDYARPATGSAEYSVTVKTSGPEECTSTGQTSVSIPAQPIPKFCFFLPLIVVFLLTEALGALVAHLAAAGLAELEGIWLLHLALVFFLLTGAAVIAWKVLATRKGCSPPDLCAFYGIGGSALLGAAVVAWYVSQFCPPLWWLAIVALAAAGILLIYTWTRKCVPEGKRLAAHLAVALLAALVCILIVSRAFSALAAG